MKRILSVILSLALLASLLIIPMSVSADPASDVTITEYTKANIKGKFTTENNVALNVVPKLYQTTTTRKEIPLKDASKLVNLSDGDLGGVEVGCGLAFKGSDGVYLNGYTPGTAFSFDGEYDAYADLIYDLGRPVDINKFQHIAANDSPLAMGVYQLYASDSVTDLFDEGSLICNYQNFNTDWNTAKSQEIEFTRTAQYVAIRCYMPITKDDRNDDYISNCFRIGDIAIYGTPSDTAAYKVTEIQAPTGGEGAPTPVPDGDLLNSATFESIKSFENGKLVKTDETLYKREEHLGKLNSQTYYSKGHGDFNLDVVFYANNTCKNGYSIDRTNTNGNIVFNVPTEDPKVYYDFTYNLGDYHKITSFGAYLYSGEDRRIQAYEVYIGNDRASLYTGEPVVVYNNYYNTYGQMITFDQAKIGKYIGFRVLNPGTKNDNGNTYVRIDELAAYGECVGTPPTIDVKSGETCGSAVVTVTDVDNNLASVKLNNQDVELDDNGKFTVTEIGDYTVVATDDKGNVTTKEINVAAHNYQYSVDGAVITETCANCDRPAETLTLTKPATIVYDSSDKSGSIDAVKTEGFANTAGKGDIVFEKGGKPVDPADVKNAGDYVAKLTIGDATAVLPFTIEKAIPVLPEISAKVGEAGNELSTIELDARFTWKNLTEKIKYSNGDKFEYDAIYTPADVDNYEIAELKIKVNGVDTIAPTGTIKIKETVWDKLANLFIKDKETVTITGSDAGSGVDKILYYVTDAEVDDSALANVEWTDYTGSFKIEKEGNNFVYAKIVDVAGKVTVISTDGIVLDTKAPSADVTNLGKYYGSLTVTVKDDNLDTVKLNGKDVTLDEEGKFVVDAADGAQKIVITDKAGNETTYTVTVVEVKGFNPAEGKLTVDMDEKNVDTAGKEKIAEKIEKGETVTFFDISVDNATGSTANVLEVPVDFDFTGKLNVRVLHKHGGNVNELKALTARPTAGFENGTFFADKENGKLYIYSKEFSPFAVAFHVHDVKHVEAKAATAEADGNIEYWYCEGCDKYFSDAAATKEIQKADTVVKYVAPSGGNTDNSNAPTTGGEAENNATVPGGTSPVTGETAMTVVLFAILLGALAVMGISIVKSRKAKSK